MDYLTRNDVEERPNPYSASSFQISETLEFYHYPINYALAGVEIAFAVFLIIKATKKFPYWQKRATTPVQRIGLLSIIAGCLVMLGTCIHWGIESEMPFTYIVKRWESTYDPNYAKPIDEPGMVWEEVLPEGSSKGQWAKYNISCLEKERKMFEKSNNPFNKYYLSNKCLEGNILKAKWNSKLEWRQSLIPTSSTRNKAYIFQEEYYSWWLFSVTFLISGIGMYRGYLERFLKWIFYGK